MGGKREWEDEENGRIKRIVGYREWEDKENGKIKRMGG